ncbi:hypothetical protein Y032_0244g3519 [Ancylostoma ceylanicum]|uniref:Uncharacterized protein n=1 Tax=Ancylostoma ceylanicum TaxID=53326 RepID=A0A016SE95_9BILA|nr:hypothetical protein Y032_0244g3519 [Ancylostoma ceylanicum]
MKKVNSSPNWAPRNGTPTANDIDNDNDIDIVSDTRKQELTSHWNKGEVLSTHVREERNHVVEKLVRVHLLQQFL